MVEWLKERKLYVLMGLGIFLFVAYTFLSPINKSVSNQEMEWNEREEDKEGSTLEEEDASTEIPAKMYVDVKGAIKVPGVYEVKEGDRVIDVIERSGGLLETANESVINFAMKVTDEMVLYIPEIGEEGTDIQPTSSTMQNGVDASGKVNLNKATESELQTIPGIGPSKAKAIIEYREQNGSFKSIDDLKLISGIGDKTFEKLKEHITVK